VYDMSRALKKHMADPDAHKVYTKGEKG
jgi:hypothetical protein